MELVDQDLGSNFDKEQAMVMINVALLCADVSPTNRPSMSSVVSMLEGRIAVPDSSVSNSNIEESKSEAMRKYYQFSIDQTTSTQSMSIDGPTTGSTSGVDLYPYNFDSSDRLL